MYKKLFNAIIFINITNFLDAITTWIAINVCGRSELNPVFNRWLQNYGIYAYFLKILLVLIITIIIYYGLNKLDFLLEKRYKIKKWSRKSSYWIFIIVLVYQGIMYLIYTIGNIMCLIIGK